MHHLIHILSDAHSKCIQDAYSFCQCEKAVNFQRDHYIHFLQFNEHQILPRTRTNYDEYCNLLEICTDTRSLEDIAKTYGITHRAGLNKIQHFHVNDGLPPDIMHDLLEGAVPCEIKCLLKKCITEEHYFTLMFFNDRMTYFQ